jgi:hypothetical protein
MTLVQTKIERPILKPPPSEATVQRNCKHVFLDETISQAAATLFTQQSYTFAKLERVLPNESLLQFPAVCCPVCACW